MENVRYGSILAMKISKGDYRYGLYNSTPAADGFRMPAEFERHQGCIMIWPERPGSWAYGAKAAKKAFAQIASVISESEQVYMIVSEGRKEEAAKMLPETVRLVIMDTDDAWARDTGPTFVVSGNVVHHMMRVICVGLTGNLMRGAEHMMDCMRTGQ